MYSAIFPRARRVINRTEASWSPKVVPKIWNMPFIISLIKVSLTVSQMVYSTKTADSRWVAVGDWQVWVRKGMSSGHCMV